MIALAVGCATSQPEPPHASTSALTEEDAIPPDGRSRERADVTASPCWYALGDVVWLPENRHEAQRSILSFDPAPHWFPSPDGEPAAPPPAIDQVNASPHGASLAVSVSTHPADPRLLKLSLTLSAKDMALARTVELRHTNVLPFLFALRADGRSVTLSRTPKGWSRVGGPTHTVELVPANERRRWDLVVAASSLERLLPDPLPTEVEIVTVFCERQHEIASLRDWFRPAVDLVFEDDDTLVARQVMRPEVLVASQVVKLVRCDQTWRMAD